MRALRTVAPHRVELVDLPPASQAAGEVAVAVLAVGLCGTDHHIFAGTYPPSRLPLIQGHEIVGRVLDPGDSGRLDLTVGTIVVIDPKRPCGHCFACRRGRQEVCEAMSVIGVHEDGGLRDTILVGAGHVEAAGPVEPGLAVLAEPASISIEAVRRAEVEVGDLAVVTGAGPIGLLAIARLVDAGARVAVVEPDPWRRSLAAVAGAELCVADDEAVLDVVAEWAGGGGPRVSLEASGTVQGFEVCLGAVRSAGVVVLAGISAARAGLSLTTIPYKGLDVRGSRNARAPMVEAVRFVKTHELLASMLVTHRLPLERAEEALGLLVSVGTRSDQGAGDEGVGKVVVEVGR